MEGLVAGFKARQIHVNVNYRYVADEVRYILDNADAATVIFGREFSPIVAQIQSRAAAGASAGSSSRMAAAPRCRRSPNRYEALAEQGDGRPLDIERSPDDLFFIYTGGTTGMPKGVMWRHDPLRRALLNPALVERVPENLDEHIEIVKAAGRGTISMPACPLMHGTGLLTAMSALPPAAA